MKAMRKKIIGSENKERKESYSMDIVTVTRPVDSK